MNGLLVCLNAIVPVFFIIAVGYLAKRAGIIKVTEVSRMNAVAFRVFMLAMCFYNVYNSDLSSAIRPKLMLFAVAGVAIMYGCSWLYGTLFVKDRPSRGVVIQGLYRSNYLILGLPIAAGLAGGVDLGAVAVLGAVVVPMFNILAVITLEVYAGEKPQIGKLLKDIAKNPLIVGSVLGLVFLLLGVRLPQMFEIGVRDLSRVASPLMLFLLGAFFRFDGVGPYRKELVAVCLGRLVIFPAIALTLALLLGFRGVEFVALLALFASPTAVASFTMAQQMGGNAELAGNIVVMTSLLCSLSFFCWSLLFKTLGVF